MHLAVLRESGEGEKRVSLVPETVKKLAGTGFKITIEAGAGAGSYFTDDAYRAAGAEVLDDPAAVLAPADLLVKVGPPAAGSSRDEIAMLRSGQMLLCSLMPTRNPRAVAALAARGVTAFSSDAIPRTTRAQAMDTLSSMANIAGYKGALIAASLLPRYCPMLMTAAGTIFPSKIFVIGAGVAGLQAIATAKRMGAQIFATDVRPEVKEQIESVGARYVGIELKKSASAGGGYAGELSEEDKARQRTLLAEQCAVSDAVITTALIGGVIAPKLISSATVEGMKQGAVIVDLAAEGGGNCELSVPGQTVTHRGVTIAAPLNLASTMPLDASTLWSRNMYSFLSTFAPGGVFKLDLADDILKGATITHGGEILHAKAREAVAAL